MKKLTLAIAALALAGCVTSPQKPTADERFLTFRVAGKPVVVTEMPHGDNCWASLQAGRDAKDAPPDISCQLDNVGAGLPIQMIAVCSPYVLNTFVADMQTCKNFRQARVASQNHVACKFSECHERQTAEDRFLTFMASGELYMVAEFSHGEYCAKEKAIIEVVGVPNAVITCTAQNNISALPVRVTVNYPSTTAVYATKTMALCMSVRDSFVRNVTTEGSSTTAGECQEK